MRREAHSLNLRPGRPSCGQRRGAYGEGLNKIMYSSWGHPAVNPHTRPLAPSTRVGSGSGSPCRACPDLRCRGHLTVTLGTSQTSHRARPGAEGGCGRAVFLLDAPAAMWDLIRFLEPLLQPAEVPVPVRTPHTCTPELTRRVPGGTARCGTGPARSGPHGHSLLSEAPRLSGAFLRGRGCRALCSPPGDVPGNPGNLGRRARCPRPAPPPLRIRRAPACASTCRPLQLGRGWGDCTPPSEALPRPAAPLH